MMRFFRPLCIVVAMFVSMVGVYSVSAQQPTQTPTTCNNVLEVLKYDQLDKSIEVVKCFENHVIARPVVRSDGTTNNSLWEHIQKKHKLKDGWTRDNTIFSRLQRQGKHSYRQKSRPSMQVVFRKFKNDFPQEIKLDLDRYPPGGSLPMSSARHLIQEVIPNFFLRRKTNPLRMNFSIKRLYKDKINATHE